MGSSNSTKSTMSERWTDLLGRLAERHLKRELRTVERSGAVIKRNGATLINLASNDYLGLASDLRLITAAQLALERYGVGAGASRLLAGNFSIHEELELEIAKFKRTEAALVFSSGYATNIGVLTALAKPNDYIYLDELVHASIHDGARLSGARVERFRHSDVDDLEHRLKTNSSRGGRIVVTDGVFSMDGELAPLPDLVAVCERYDALLVVDDAHGTGVVGPKGRGTVAYFDLEDRVPVQIGTLSKALGVQGGFVAGSKELIQFLINRARSFIYSTGIAPALAAAALEALRIAEKEDWRRCIIAEYRRLLMNDLRAKGYNVLGEAQAPMLSVILGEPEVALNLSRQLEVAGAYAPAIRPPTVPRGTSRIRLAPIATHSSEQIETVLTAFPEIGK
jgi:8-amino-7-oxononanoate synthase